MGAAIKKGLKPMWFSTGKDERLILTTQAINWRNYLNTFAPQLFR